MKSPRKRRTPYQLTRSKFLTDDEYEDLHKTLTTEISAKRPRDAVLILLALHTGARAQELLNIRPKDLDPKARSVYIRGLKNSKDREIPLPDWLFSELEGFAKNSQKTIFGISYRRLEQVWKFNRTTKKKFHALRHTFAYRLYQRTKDIRLVQNALGHRSLMNTMIYLDFDYSVNQMRRLIVEE